MTPERFIQLENVYMEVAEKFASMSLATRSRVGAVIIKDSNLISFGWNGMPSGFPNNEIELEVDGKLVTNPLTLHAEANAILKCARKNSTPTENATLFVTLSPCVECCKLIIQAGIKRVVYRDLYRDETSIKILRLANIIVDQLPREET